MHFLANPEELDLIPDVRDSKGRLIIIRPEAWVRLLFERLGFDTEGSYHSAGRLGREGLKSFSTSSLPVATGHRLE